MAQYMKRQLNSVKDGLKVYAHRLVSVNLCFFFLFFSHLVNVGKTKTQKRSDSKKTANLNLTRFHRLN